MGLKFKVFSNYAAVAGYEDDNGDGIVVVPREYQGKPVTAIMGMAFRREKITAIALPESIEQIGDFAFEGCKLLTRVRAYSPTEKEPLDDNLSSIFPSKLSKIGAYAFAQTALIAVSFHSPALNIGDYAFKKTHSLRAVLILETKNLVLGTGVWEDSSVQKVLGSLVHISHLPEKTFFNCAQLEKITFHFDSCGAGCFDGCTALNDKPSCDEIILRRAPTVIAPHKTKMQKWDDEMISPSETAAPLFSTTVVSNGQKGLPPKISGQFRREKSAYYFDCELPLGGWAQLKVDSDEHIDSFLDVLIEESTPIGLAGRQSRDRTKFYVHHMEDMDGNYDPDFFSYLISRLKRSPLLNVSAQESHRYLVSDDGPEYDMFLSSMKGRLPAWVFEAYKKNTCPSGCRPFSREERNHAEQFIHMILNIEWNLSIPYIPTLEETRAFLDEQLYGLERVKERILEIVAQIRQTNSLPKWGILLNGPAGVGKTAIVDAIAELFCLNKIEVDLSSLCDQEYISGSGRIYSNATPGLFLSEYFKNGTSTNVLLVNEVDKAAESSDGKATANALLSVLDKTGVRDLFAEERIPTSNLLCIATCNDINAISKPLRDRFLQIDVPAYSAKDKQTIMRDYVLPKRKAASGIPSENLIVPDESIALLTQNYCCDPGARDLETAAERIIGDYCKTHELTGEQNQTYTPERIRALLGPGRVIRREWALHSGMVQAAFYHGGEAHIFLVEATVRNGSGTFEFLGPMSKMQQEYGKIAYWAVRNTATIDLSKKDVVAMVTDPLPDGGNNHVGLAVYAAICSALLGIRCTPESLFIGGVDLVGIPYWDENTNDLTPLLQAVSGNKIRSIFAPAGVTNVLPQNWDCSNIKIVEAPDSKTLISLALEKCKSDLAG